MLILVLLFFNLIIINFYMVKIVVSLFPLQIANNLIVIHFK